MYVRHEHICFIQVHVWWDLMSVSYGLISHFFNTFIASQWYQSPSLVCSFPVLELFVFLVGPCRPACMDWHLCPVFMYVRHEHICFIRVHVWWDLMSVSYGLVSQFFYTFITSQWCLQLPSLAPSPLFVHVARPSPCFPAIPQLACCALPFLSCCLLAPWLFTHSSCFLFIFSCIWHHVLYVHAPTLFCFLSFNLSLCSLQLWVT